jgi:hypothetical protein
MILGRPTNLWLGLTTAALGFIQIAITSLHLLPDVEPQAIATTLGALGLLLGAAIALIAGQPPTLNVGDAYNVTTPTGQPNVTKVANTNVTAIPPNAGTTDPKPGG